MCLMTRNLTKQKYGKNERYTFSRIKEVMDIPYLVEVQKDSYDAFIKEGIDEVFEDFSPITDYSNHFELSFLDHTLENKPKYDMKECRDRDATYALPLRVTVRLYNKQTGEIKDQNVFMGDLPLMTENGSFIINGAERVVVSQLVRSPGVYNKEEKDKNGHSIYETTIIPSRGAWLEFKQDSQDKDILWVNIDRTRKVTATVFLRSLGYGTNDCLNDMFANNFLIKNTAAKDTAQSESEALTEVYRRLRPGEMPSDDSVRSFIEGMLFDNKKYDLAKVGRYKYNKKLCFASRIVGQTLSRDAVDKYGEVILSSGEVISVEKAKEIQNSGINEIFVRAEVYEQNVDASKIYKLEGVTLTAPCYDVNGKVALKEGTVLSGDLITKYGILTAVKGTIEHKMIGNATVDIEALTGINCKEYRRSGMYDKYVYYPVFDSAEFQEEFKPALDSGDKEQIASVLKKYSALLCPKHVTREDILASISNNLDLRYNIGVTDNIDHLANRRVRSVGELLQNQFRVGISRLEKVIKERMSTQNPEEMSPQSLINVRPVTAAIREFFGSSQLSQFMDQSNPIAELTHKRKLSALGPGGINRDRATFDVRDVHHTHYGRLCPIETPEGQNIGLISSLSTYAKINEYGFIESPYRRVDKATGVVSLEPEYLPADIEDLYIVAQAKEPLDEQDRFINDRILCRQRDEIIEVAREEVDYMDVSPKQLVSVATALIPFLENDDTNRALMGSNMQRQAVPLLVPEAPIVGTGIEAKIAYDSGVMVLAKEAGYAKSVSANEIVVAEDDGNERVYTLKKFERSNQATCLNQRPIVHNGDRIEKGDILADGHSTDNGELALGRNILIGFMSWEGYNYEDAILISEELVKNDVFTSIHIEEYETDAREITRLGAEEITRDIPNVGEDALKDLGPDGIVRIGAEVTSGDILVGKVTPKGEAELTPEERLLRAIFGDKAREVRDTSLKVPHGEGGVVVDVKVFTRENKDELAPGVNKVVRVYIAQKRKISIGDKMAGRHGNKGVISRILPVEDMPFLADGTPLQIVLNPLGVPSRMNIGQVLEVHLGLVCKELGWKIATPVFDGATEADIKELLKENNFLSPEGKVDGKIQLYDGRTGEPFENRVTVGQMYMLKLVHLVDDKIHARSTGPYSLVTQQPLGGKAQFGGQRFGEMEVWALEAYGAAHILQEILTVKSDDVVGRVKTYDSIVRGNSISEPGIPESFKVLLKELLGLGLDIRVRTENNEEIELKELIDNDYDSLGIPETRHSSETKEEVSLKEDEHEFGEGFESDDDIDIDSEYTFNSGELFDDDADDFDIEKDVDYKFDEEDEDDLDGGLTDFSDLDDDFDDED